MAAASTFLSRLMAGTPVQPFRDDYKPEHPHFRRTICRHWLRGRCERGDLCNFAHGEAQVQRAAAAVESIKPGSPSALGPDSASAVLDKYEELAQDYVLVSAE